MRKPSSNADPISQSRSLAIQEYKSVRVRILIPKCNTKIRDDGVLAVMSAGVRACPT